MNTDSSRGRSPGFGRIAGGLASGLVLALAGLTAIAAPVSLPGAVQPGRDRPLPQPEAAPDFEFSVETPGHSAVPRAVDEIRFRLAGIKITGTSVFPAETFRPLYAKLIGTDIALSDIQAVADAIEKTYRDAGYLLVRAYVPRQRVSDGVFSIAVVEGFVDGVSVEGGDRDVAETVKSYLAPVRGEHPLRRQTIERALLLSNDIPGVAATGVLRPSPTVPGASDLVVTLTQPPVAAALSSNNRGSHFSGIWTATATAAYNGLFDADSLDTALTMAPRSVDQQLSGQLHYREAIGDDGLIASLLGSASHGAPGGSLGKAQIRTDSFAGGPRLSYPLERSRDSTITLDAGFTVQEARVRILGAKASYDKWRVVDLSLGYAGNGDRSDSFNTALDIAQGVPVLGASPDHSHDLSLDGQSVFTKATATLHYTNSAAAPVSFAISGLGQYALQPLITGEQSVFGGSQIGRGYDPGAITGDDGAGGSFELRYDTRVEDLAIQNLQPYAFADAARVWDRPRPAAAGIPLKDYSIGSAGFGVRIWLPMNLYLDLEGARTFNAVPGSDGGKVATKFLTDIAIAY